MVRFRDRSDAGWRLAIVLRAQVGPDALVVGLTRGGVPVAYEVARRLRAPLDVLVVRKLGVPWQGELAMGAIASGGARAMNADVVRLLRISPAVVEAVAADEQREIERRERIYRRGQPAADVQGREIVVVDDGLATGASMRAAIASLRARGAARITVAVPAGSPETCEELRALADEVVCLSAPEAFFAVGQFYEDFAPTSDEQVRDLVARAASERQARLAAHGMHG